MAHSLAQLCLVAAWFDFVRTLTHPAGGAADITDFRSTGPLLCYDTKGFCDWLQTLQSCRGKFDIPTSQSVSFALVTFCGDRDKLDRRTTT